MLSPGVYVHEEDRSQVVASSSSSVGVFAGDFVKGPIGAYKLINTLEELEGYYGKPTPNNQNDWFQVQNYLTYASQIYVARAGNVNGKETCFVNGVSVLEKEETFDDQPIKEKIARYKENLNYLDEWVWNLVIDEANNRGFDLSEMDRILKLDSYTEQEALQASNTIDLMSELINEILKQEVQSLIDLMERF